VRITVTLLLVVSTFFSCNEERKSATEKSGRYEWKYHTITHQLIQIEEKVNDLPAEKRNNTYDSKYELLDHIITSCKPEIEIIRNKNLPEEEKAILVFQHIHKIISAHNFLLCVKTETLSEGFTPLKVSDFMDDCALRLTADSEHNYRLNPNDDYYHFDCDIGSFIYLAVGEALQLPFTVTEIPDHFFVRWVLPDSSYINWDVNSVGSYSDSIYLTDFPCCKTTSELQTLYSGYLQNMTDSTIYGYHYAAIASKLDTGKDIEAALHYYAKSIKLRPNNASVLNNLAWLLLTREEFKSSANYQWAYEIAAKADSLTPDDIMRLDTYSCACAAIGDFDKAIELEKRARNLDYKIEGYRKGMTCLELGEGG
jgi:tetratricopeptide (TPR) repeat protein